MGAESGCASWGGTGHQDTHEPSRLHDHWLLVTDQGKNYLTFVDVTEDFTIMDLENQSEGGTVLVSELHGGCCSHPSLKTAGNVGLSSWRGGWEGRGD